MKTLITSILLATIASSSFAGQNTTPLQDFLVKNNAVAKVSSDAIVGDKDCATSKLGFKVNYEKASPSSKINYTICAVDIHDTYVQALKDLTGNDYKGTIYDIYAKVKQDIKNESEALILDFEH